jgi:hypothetical protein
MRCATLVLSVAAVLVLGAVGASPAVAASPALRITSTAYPSHFAPGDQTGAGIYVIRVTNVGSAPTDGSPITISDTLPAGISLHPGGGAILVESVALDYGSDGLNDPSLCQPGPPVSCSTLDHATSPSGIPPVLEPDGYFNMSLAVDIASLPDPTAVTNHATVSGGGAPTATSSEQTQVSSTAAPFGFQDSSFSLIDSSGNPATQAGARPWGLNARFALNSIPGDGRNFATTGSLRDAHVSLPRGLVVNPDATPERCTEAELETLVLVDGDPVPGCPAASAVGIARATGLSLGAASGTFDAAVYNMVPPPGAPAELAFNIKEGPVFGHLLGGVDSAGDYRLTADATQIAQFGGLVGLDLDLWGDPSSPAHDSHRGPCVQAGHNHAGCPVAVPDPAPFLTMPSACSGPLQMDLSFDSYADPGDFIDAHPQTTDSQGTPVGVSGCSALEFKPTLKARPTTNVADSPSGLSVDLHVPQTNSLGTLATSNLRDTTVTLPEGLVVNPSAANGLGACTSAQIGLTTQVGQTPIHFSAGHPSCPDSARIGTVEVDTPLLEDPLPGSVYIAAPHDNPFDSLLALYVVVDDPQTGVVAKLAGKVEADPLTGRLTTTFSENPELPFEDFKLEFFGGAGGALRTPPTCGDYSTTSSLAPWSGNPPATPSDSYSIDQAPGGGACPTDPAALPNSPSFDAGTLSPLAGTYSPFVLNLRRADDTQQFSAVTVSPPPGLVGKLAGTPACPEASLLAAAAKSGSEELAAPSCPPASQVGTVDVAAGAGPAPYNAPGKAYLAGPYKSAPLSLAIITPAVAGPFDLGTVVTRVALHVNPATTQITAIANPIPQILQGIVLDVRSVAIRLDKPSFTLNGTSCDPAAVSGTLLSALGQATALNSRFQLGECGRLGFKPKIALSLKGGTRRNKNPALTATLTYPKGTYANIASAQVTLPHSAFLDQAHIGTVCTRVQFAAHACPAASVYGKAIAYTPLLDQPLSGPVYLRSSSNPLPDLVADLNGQIEVTLDGKVDTGKGGGIRNTFTAVPDAPVSKFVLSFEGGKQGLLVNSENLCGPHAKTHAIANFTGQNGKVYDTTPKVQNSCKKKSEKHKGHKHRGAHK